MTKQTENDVRNSLRDYLLYQGWLVLRVNSGALAQTDQQTGKRRFFAFVLWQILGIEPQRAGVSDILAVQPGTGRLWAIEAKKPGKLGEVTEKQRAFLRAVEARGGVAIVADSIDLLRERIKQDELQRRTY